MGCVCVGGGGWGGGGGGHTPLFIDTPGSERVTHRQIREKGNHLVE